MAGKVDRLVADAFLQAAVAGDHIGVVVDEFGAETGREHALGQRHADGGRNALAERAGGRLDAQRMAVFGMAGGAAAELAEALQLLDRHVGIAEQIMQRVLQHRAMAGRQHEAVAVRPVRPRRIELDEAVEQHRRDVGHAHRHAGMARIRLLHGVHRQRADGVGHVAFRDGGSGAVLTAAWLFMASSSRDAVLAFDQLQDQRRQDQLHGEVELVARHDDGIRPAT